MRSSPSHVRLVVRDEAGEEVLIDVGHDFRLREPQRTSLGPVLTVEELAADKLLALFGRAEPRDFVDIFCLARRFPVADILRWAKEKDSGMDSYVLATMIGQLAKLPRHAFVLGDDEYQAMCRFYDEFRQRLIDQALSGSADHLPVDTGK